MALPRVQRNPRTVSMTYDDWLSWLVGWFLLRNPRVERISVGQIQMHCPSCRAPLQWSISNTPCPALTLLPPSVDCSHHWWIFVAHFRSPHYKQMEAAPTGHSLVMWGPKVPLLHHCWSNSTSLYPDYYPWLPLKLFRNWYIILLFITWVTTTRSLRLLH